MGKNKLRKFDEVNNLNNVIQYTFKDGLPDAEGHKFRGEWSRRFFANESPLILELGCGKGEYTVELGRLFSNKNFIGVDIKGARIWKGAKEADCNNISNVAFLRTRIEFVNFFFLQNEIDEIWLTFPDPQMKKDSKRLTSSFFMKRYEALLKPEGIIHLKTDSNFQYEYTKALVEKNGLSIVEQYDNVYEQAQGTILTDIKTYYEKQWLDRGITIKYISFRLDKKNADWQEPDVEIEPDEYRSFGRSAKDL
ncbi:MAG: tRNA (guanosine(46)-N7)-methyltransferase TrmB [Bacteroidales bacterium]